jgi:hypothetical protein
MAKLTRANLVVTLQGDPDPEATRKRVMRIPGVRGADYNCVTSKLMVWYDADERDLTVQSRVRKELAPFLK